MQHHKRIIILIVLWSFCFSQKLNRTVDDIKEEWVGYTSFQKEEMISFCDFLFQDRHYERCLLVAFQILYKLPNDPAIPTINYYIARCYEEMKSYELAHKYYNEVKRIDTPGSLAYKAAEYRNHYVSLLANEIDELLINTKNTDDPYLMTFRGYAYLKRFEWERARTSFIAAQSIFNHSHYNDLMNPLFQTIEKVGSIPNYNKYIVFFTSSIFPGGGQFLLKEWNKGQGVLTSVGLMYLILNWAQIESYQGADRILDNYSSSVPIVMNFESINRNIKLKQKDRLPMELKISNSSFNYLAPPLFIGAGIFIGSMVNSFKDTKHKNKKLIQYYIDDKIKKFPPSRFLDLSEPSLIITQ